MVNPAAAQARLRHMETLSLVTEQVLCGDAAVLKGDIGVHAVALLDVGAYRRVANNLHARGALLHQEDGRALMNRCVGVSDHHDQQEGRKTRVGGKPLFAIDDPVSAISRGSAKKLTRVGARLWLGHRIAGRDFSIEQWLKILFFLLGCAEFGQNFRIAGIGCLTAKYAGPKAAATENLIHQSQADLPVALSAQLWL